MSTSDSESDTDSVKKTEPQLVQVKINNFAEFLSMIPEFSGSEDLSIEQFIEKLHEISSVADWTEQQILTAAKLKLSGEAGRFAKSHPLVKKCKNLEELKTQLKNRFGKPGDNNCLLKFTQATQKINENTRSFLSKLSGLAHSCFPNDEVMREQMLYNQALKGLNSTSRRFIMNLCPKKFQDIWDGAIQEEQCLEFEKLHAEINVGAMFSQAQKESSEIAEMKNIIQANMLENDKRILELTNQVQNLTTLVQASHSAQQPYNRDRNRHNHRQDIICYNCNVKGHISRFCPSKKKTSHKENLNQ